MPRQLLALVLVAVCFTLILWSGIDARQSRPPAVTPAHTIEPANTPAVETEADAVASPLLDKPAPDFTLRDLAGHTVRLSDYRGKAVLINFWATWCAPCTIEMPWFVALQRKYGAEGFVMLGIDKDYPEDLSKVPGFARKMALNYPVLFGDTRTYSAYGCCDYLPMSYYVDRSGSIRIATVGLGSRDSMESNVRRILQAPRPQIETEITASTATTPSPPSH